MFYAGVVVRVSASGSHATPAPGRIGKENWVLEAVAPGTDAAFSWAPKHAAPGCLETFGVQYLGLWDCVEHREIAGRVRGKGLRNSTAKLPHRAAMHPWLH